MKCVTCDKDAQAICKFCGRAVCADHIKESQYPSGFATKLAFWSSARNGVVVANAVWCGKCKVDYFGTA